MPMERKDFVDAKDVGIEVASKVYNFLLDNAKAYTTAEIAKNVELPEKRVEGILLTLSRSGTVVGKEIEIDKIFWLHNIPVKGQ